jgi:hypothetical protein
MDMKLVSYQIATNRMALLLWVTAMTLILPGFMATPVEAACTSTSQCPSHMVCMNSMIPGIKECKQQMCNADTECPSARPRCLNGACMAPAGTGGGTSGESSGGGTTGGTLGDVGQSCGPYKIGGVTKSRGCKQGLQCVNRTCQPLAR